MVSSAIRILMAAIIMLALITAALAVGYEQVDPATRYPVKSWDGREIPPDRSFSSAKETCVEYLDSVAFFTRDLLSQFGLSKSRDK